MNYNVVAIKKTTQQVAFRDVTPRTKTEAEAEANRRNNEDEERTIYRFSVMSEADAATL